MADQFTKIAKSSAIRRRIAEINKRLKEGCSCDEHPCMHADWRAERKNLRAELQRRKQAKRSRRHEAGCYYSGEEFTEVNREDPMCGCGTAEAVRKSLTRDDLEDEVDRLRTELEECRRSVAILNPPEPEDGSVVKFQILFEHHPLATGMDKSYTYYAARIGSSWYLTGDGLGAFGRKGSWAKLCDAIRAHDVGIDAYHNGSLTISVNQGVWAQI